MVPKFLNECAPLARIVFRTALCAVLCLPAKAFQNQNQIQIESTGPDRKIKTRIAPEYPELARRTKIVGTARVEMIVNADGSVGKVKEIGGNPVLLEALVRAVKQWRYEPATRESTLEVKAAFYY